MTELVFIVPGRLDQITGGYLFDRHIVEGLRLELSPDEQNELAKGSTTDAGASEEYLRGRNCLGQFIYHTLARADVDSAIEHFQRAVELDPKFALAHSALGSCYVNRVLKGLGEPGDHEKAEEAFNDALALDPNLGEAHAALAFIRRAYDWDWVGADVSARRALDLEPGNGTVILGAARVASGLGRLDEALDLTRRAAMSDPLNVAIHYRLARYFLFLGRLDEAVASFSKVLELNPEYPAAHEDLALVYLAQSRPEAALAEMAQEKADLWRHYGFSLVY